jgi:DNA primase
MARFPDDELERIKTQIDLAALVRSKGIELKPHGGKDLVGLSPFTDEKTPSFIVSPQKNLWHCMSSGQGGSVIDFVMKHDGVSFRHAVLLLQEQNPGNGSGAEPVSRATVPKLAAPVDLDADDHALMEQVLGYYRERLVETPAALDYLKSRGITAEAIEAFGLGLADRTLGLRLPLKNRSEGAAIRSRLQKLGLFRESGHEHFNGCVVFPIRGPDGHVSELYGRKVGKRQKSELHHLYLPGPHRGIWNPAAFESPEVILCESIIDALTFWCAARLPDGQGLRHVTCIYGTEGFTDEHREAFEKHRPRRVYLAYDRDKAGDRAAERDASRLASLGIETLRVLFPPGQDANQYALKVTPPGKALETLLRGAVSLSGNLSTVPSSLAANSVSRSEEVETPEPAPVAESAAKGNEARQRGNGVVERSGAALSKAKGEEGGAPSGPTDEQKESSPSVSSAPSVVNPASPESSAVLKAFGDDWEAAFGERVYRVRGLGKNTALEVLKINLRVRYGETFYLDTLDLYRAKERAHFVAAAADETGLQPDILKRDLGKLLFALEELQERRIAAAMQPQSAEDSRQLSEEEKEAALALLKSPNLFERILADFTACGIVGEATNLLTGYLAAVSRKLDRPLAIIIQSTSAAGKTSLMEAVLSMMPEEERIKYSAMTGQSLYYLGETNLKHKILAIVEEEGAEKASYALKLLQSEGELTIASTGKDEQGRMKTEEYHVEGPVMIFLTTTAIDIDEELLNRCLVLTVDESREQTQAIHRLQREAETFEGLKRKLEREKILTIHRNAQRLLRPLHVVNPFAPRLTFLSDRTRTRRDHVKYLTLIRTIALLHQYQRPLKERDGARFIEVTLADIEAANRLAHEVLGRSLDELPPQSRRLLERLHLWVAGQCAEQALERHEFLFSRRKLRETIGWSDTQLKVHLARLVEMEYLLIHRNPQHAQGFCYELVYDGEGREGSRFLPGLIEAEGLGQLYDPNRSGLKANRSGAGRGAVGPRSGGGPGPKIDAEPSDEAASGEADEDNGENARKAS